MAEHEMTRIVGAPPDVLFGWPADVGPNGHRGWLEVRPGAAGSEMEVHPRTLHAEAGGDVDRPGVVGGRASPPARAPDGAVHPPQRGRLWLM